MAHKTKTQPQKTSQDSRRGGIQTAQAMKKAVHGSNLSRMSEEVVRRRLRLMCAKDPALKSAYRRYLQDYEEVRATYGRMVE